jgi:predicted ATPase
VIKNLRIERFKCYRDQSFRFGALTVLAGTNGTGKSTVLQALLLIRLINKSRGMGAELNGPYGLKLGEVLDVLNREATPEEGIRLTIESDPGQSQVIDFAIAGERCRVLSAAVSPEKGLFPFNASDKSFTFLSADRLGPQDAFEAHDLGSDGINVGWRGEAVAQVLVDTERQEVLPVLVRNMLSGDHAPLNVPRQTELWLSDIVRPIQLNAQWVPGTNVITLRFKEPVFQSEWMRPANTGFGLSSALPIVVAGLHTPKDGMLMVENPETHLHPRGQSKIGEFLARVAASGVQVVVETHSDHVLNGIRRAVAIDKVLPNAEVLVHFFDDELTEAGSTRATVRTLELKPNGDISDWPRHFFDQIETDLAALARVRRAK